MLLRIVVRMLPVALMLMYAGVVPGQGYPNKPIRVVTTGVGGDGDFMARLIAQGISGSLGQQMIVDNRPSGVISGQVVSKAPADGYTLLVTANHFWLSTFMRSNLPYDPVADFSPITLISTGPNVLVAHPSVAANSVKELVALGKAKPGELNYSAGSAGGSSHLGAELFKALAGVNIVRVPYKSGSLRQAALLSGEVQIEFSSPGSVAPHIKLGKLRALGVTSSRPSTLAPGVPPVGESLPGYEQTAMNGMLAPANTPAATINRLNQEVARFLKQPEVKQRFFDAGAETAGGSPAEFTAAIKSDMARMGKVIKDVGIRDE